jgi:heme o synthase
MSSVSRDVELDHYNVDALGSQAEDFFQLLKPRVMSLVVFTATIGILRSPEVLHPFLFGLSVLCIAVAAGASGALNMWYERHLDAQMMRTRTRPIPSGKVDAGEALAFGLILSVGSVLLMGLALNWAAAAWLLFTILFYVVVYTVWLKPRTDQNIVIGGVAGALPPLVGWVSVTGQVTLEPFLLFLLIFLWTPPHFWALAMVCGQDYQKANLPMLPQTKGRGRAALESFLYTIFVVITSLSLCGFGFAGLTYFVGALVLGSIFLCKSFDLFRDVDNDKKAKSLFGFSILYLFGLFSLLGIDSFL